MTSSANEPSLLPEPARMLRVAGCGRAPFVSRWFGPIVLTMLLVPGHLAGYLVERSTVAFLVLLLGITFVSHGWRGILPSLHSGLSPKALAGMMWVVGLVYVLATLLHPGETSQWSEVLRFPVYGSLLLLLFLSNRLSTIGPLKWATKFTIFYSVAILFLLRVTVPVLSPLATSMYESAKMRWGTASGTRFSAPFENPNYLAFFLIVAVSYLLALEEDDVLSTRLAVLAAVVLLVLTGSRSGYIAGVALGASFLAMRAVQKVMFRSGTVRVRRKAARTVMLVAGLITAILLAPLASRLQSSRLEMIEQIFASPTSLPHSIRANTDDSITGRLQSWRMTMDDIEGSPIVGVGAWKTQVVDNQFLIWTSRVGVVGLVLILTIWLSLVLAANRGDFQRRRPMSIWTIVLPSSVMLGTGAFVSNFRLFFFFAAVLISLAVVDPLPRDEDSVL